MIFERAKILILVETSIHIGRKITAYWGCAAHRLLRLFCQNDIISHVVLASACHIHFSAATYVEDKIESSTILLMVNPTTSLNLLFKGWFIFIILSSGCGGSSVLGSS
jgi:hypothetical protein